MLESAKILPPRQFASRAPLRRARYKDELVQPFLKWAGGKRQLIPRIREHVGIFRGRYFEPFIGAGAILFDLQPAKAHINDTNRELMNCYRVIKSDPEALIAHARRHRTTADYYYRVRGLDRRPSFERRTPVERASRFLYLNKNCFNGLYRVNSKGHFNVPFGRFTNPTILRPETIRAVSRYLNENDIEITHLDYALAVAPARRGDFVYLDPPYHPVSETAYFTDYNLKKFDEAEQVRLKTVFDLLTARGCKVLLSNSATPFIRDLYRDYRAVEVEATRNINSVAAKRGKIGELLILNFDIK